MKLLSPRFRTSLRAILLALMIGVCTSGCGYVVGSPYSQEIRTVHVPTFQNDTYRRGIELQLTEAVHKQIQLTPYRLSKGPSADTRLTGRIISASKRVSNQNKFDDPREIELSIALEVTWTDLRSGQVISQRQIPLDGVTAHAVVDTSFAPEAGQSLASANQSAMDQLARQVVTLMEAPW